MNERTHFFIKIYLSHFILERVIFFVCERWVGDGDRLLHIDPKFFWPQQHFFHILAGLLNRGFTEGPNPLSGAGSHSTGMLSPTNSNSNWNLPKPSDAPGYIIVSRKPSSTVPLLIYTGASLDGRLGRGSIYNNCESAENVCVSVNHSKCNTEFCVW